MDLATPCPSCSRLCRVDAADAGTAVACPHCGRPFRAPDHADAEPLPAAEGLTPALVGLALVAWGVPALWLLALLVSGVEPLFTFAVPVALAVGATGLGLGVGSASLWSHATRAKALVALLVMAYGTAGGLYFLQREWGESLRKLGRPGDWRPVSTPQFTVKMPGDAVASPSPLAGWEMTALRCVDASGFSTDTFVAAHGRPPAGAPADTKAWFESAKAAVAGDGQVFAETDVVSARLVGFQIHQYVVGLPDGVTNRVVWLMRGRGQTYYLAAEGLFFRPDSTDVQTFFRSFSAAPRP